nr:hypothetical protein CFP56_36324 [Quercus suber]
MPSERSCKFVLFHLSIGWCDKYLRVFRAVGKLSKLYSHLLICKLQSCTHLRWQTPGVQRATVTARMEHPLGGGSACSDWKHRPKAPEPPLRLNSIVNAMQRDRYNAYLDACRYCIITFLLTFTEEQQQLEFAFSATGGWVIKDAPRLEQSSNHRMTHHGNHT